MIDAPSDGAPEQAPRWDLVGTEGCVGGIRFLAPYLIVWGYVGIYRRKEYVGGATWGPRGWRARLGGRRPPTSWLPGSFLDVESKSHGSCLMRDGYSFKSKNNDSSIYMSNIFYGHAPLMSGLFLLNLDSSDT